MRARRRLRRVLGLAGLIIVVLLSLEFGARLYLAQHAFIFHYPANIDRLREGSARMGFVETDGGYYVYGDVSSEFFNVENHIRRTIGQPANWRQTVWLFGNSTLADHYASDTETIASDLQGLLNDHGYAWRVVNLGVESYSAALEYVRLRDTPIQPGDLVIFIDGAPDAESSYYWCDPRRTWAERYALATVFCDSANRLFQADVQPAVKSYERSIALAEQYAREHIVAFHHFYQPDNPASEETHYAISRFYAALSHRLYRLTAPTGAFVDNVHLLPPGDAAVAQQIYDQLSIY